MDALDHQASRRCDIPSMNVPVIETGLVRAQPHAQEFPLSSLLDPRAQSIFRAPAATTRSLTLALIVGLPLALLPRVLEQYPAIRIFFLFVHPF